MKYFLCYSYGNEKGITIHNSYSSKGEARRQARKLKREDKEYFLFIAITIESKDGPLLMVDRLDCLNGRTKLRKRLRTFRRMINTTDW